MKILDHEYIMVSDIVRIRTAKTILTEVIPGSNSHIDFDEWQTMIGTLVKWEHDIYHRELGGKIRP